MIKLKVCSSFSFSGNDSAKARAIWFEFSKAGRVAHVPDNVVEEFPKITTLSIVNSELPIVKNELLNEQFNRLQMLNLFSNGIQIIEEKAFAQLVNLQGIFLHKNKIQSLSGRVFERNLKLKWISLMRNQIKMIDSDTFKNLNRLENVKLHGNKCFNHDIGCMNCRRKIDPRNMDQKLRVCYSNYRKSFNFLNEAKDTCGVQAPSGLILPGDMVKTRDYPWAGAFFDRDQFYCGGNLITPRHVLVAAHCLQDKGQTLVKKSFESHIIFQDDHSAANDSAKGEVFEFIIHPDWDPKDSHYTADIAIAVLREPIELSDDIQYVCWNTPSDPIQGFAGKNGMVYGWGLTEEFKTVSKLRQVPIPLVDQAECHGTNRAFRSIMSNTSFCAGAKDGRTGACSGDSAAGMALIVDGLWKIIGIISASLTMPVNLGSGSPIHICDLENYVVYTDVSKFHEWINQVVLET